MLRFLCSLFVVSTVVGVAVGQRSELQFNRDIRPILADNCFRCHGPDAKSRKAGLRLDTRAGMLAAGKRGRAVVPGRPDQSLFVARIEHADSKERMPPAKSGRSLTAAQRERLREWVQRGAPWQDHWSFEALRQPALPGPTDQQPIDRLLAARIEAAGVPPSPPADPRTLVRRLHFDLVGLPPQPSAVEALDPEDPASYEAMVDRLLASPAHAERLAVYWLDLVRYADSCGIHGDQPIPMSPYRDWVIRSFRENKPFDAFTREQIAGDLLPDGGVQQKVASGYNRLNMKTAEGGAQEAEYLAKYAADRVRTTATVWMGATLGCAECHDHKFDPFTAKDFYRFAAFFADLDHRGYYGGANRSGDWGPNIRVPTPEQQRQLDAIEAEIEGFERELVRSTPALVAAQRDWERETKAQIAAAQPPVFGAWRSIGPFAARSLRAAHDREFGPERSATAEGHAGQTWREQPNWVDGKVHTLTGANSATYLERWIESPVEQQLQLSLGSDDSIKLWINGDLVLSRSVARGVKPGQERPTVTLTKGRNRLLMKVSNGGGGYAFYFDAERVGPPAPIAALLDRGGADRSVAEESEVAEYFRSITPLLAEQRKQLAAKRKAKSALAEQIATSLVSRQRATPREIRVLPRGNWQDKSGAVVTPGVPAFLPQPVVGTRRLTRMDLANWLVSEQNPLTARVFVNRMWKLFFGRGLCATLDDVGSQAAWPRQLELLDWLAADFRRDWDVRRLVKQIVMSAAYRRSSDVTPAAMERDPENELFARQGRFRHDAEVIRDQALAVSGLLDRTVGGPSVKPYQPAGHWAQLNFPPRKWQHDVGSAQYRRGIYTHWQRTFLHPSMRAFDAPTREECTAERPRSNTPLQALVLLNDPSYVEAARVFAARLLQQREQAFEQRLRAAFRRHLARAPTASEVSTLRNLWQAERERYRADPAAADKLAAVGLNETPPHMDRIELAAWTAVTRVLFNLHEAITRY